MISAEANLRHLKTLVGADVDFHDDQEDAINSCLEKGSRTLLVQKLVGEISGLFYCSKVH